MIRCLAILCCSPLLLAQEFAGVTSPDGHISFFLDVAQPPGDSDSLPGLAYQVRYNGRRVMDTSFLGFDVWAQEPLLGEKVGLSAAKNTQEPDYNAVYAEYLQQGSLGRRVNIEARVYNNGIAFRYVVPPSTPLMDLFLRDEITEFRFAGDASLHETPLIRVPKEKELKPPLVAEVLGTAWVSIQESGADKPFTLRHYEGNKLVLRLPRLSEDPTLAVKSHPTWKSSWRVLLIGPTEASVQSADFLSRLPKE